MSRDDVDDIDAANEPSVYRALLDPQGPDAQALQERAIAERRAAETRRPGPASVARLSADDAKRLTTLQARAALKGTVLHALDDDRGELELIATRWSMTRSLRTLDEAGAWLDRVVGGRATIGSAA